MLIRRRATQLNTCWKRKPSRNHKTSGVDGFGQTGGSDNRGAGHARAGRYAPLRRTLDTPRRNSVERPVTLLHGLGNEDEGDPRYEERRRPRKRKPICPEVCLSFLCSFPGIRSRARLAPPLCRTESRPLAPLRRNRHRVGCWADIPSHKSARSLLASGGIAPDQITELASALGTLELSSNTKNAKRLFRTALENPNDNSLAQAGWVSRRFGLFEIASGLSERTALAYEQQAWQHYLASNWREALRSALSWREDQPFSSRPAVFASFLSGVGLEDYEQSSRICQLALIASPDDFGLLNNLAFSLAKLGRADEARAAFCRIDPKN